LSKIEAGKIDFINAEFSLQDTMSGIYQTFAGKCREKGNTLSYSIDGSIPELLSGDQLRLIQILNNLVNNAVKFTSNGLVNIKVTPTGHVGNKIELLFEITDTGIGISEANQKKIFEDFVQADSGIAQRFGGTGLGLAITKKLIELQGGEIGVESELNKGSRFYFKLQLEAAQPKKTGGVITEKAVVDVQPLENIRVLLAEDIVVNQKVATSYLNHWKAEVVCANNGAEALAIFAQEDFDILLIDLYMPVMNGFEAIKKLRETTRGKNIPIMALTASADTVTLKSAIDSGADACLSKPFDAKQLLATIKKLLKNYKSLSESTDQEPQVANKGKTLKYVDLRKIEEASLGDNNFIKTMIDTLKAEVPPVIKQCKIMLGNKNYEQFAREVHKLKNCLLMLGMDDLKNDLAFLEEARKKPEPKVLEDVFGKINAAWENAEQELQNL